MSGSAGGGKSYSIVIDSCLKAVKYPGIKLLILRRSFPQLQRSVIQTFLEIIPKEFYSYNSSKHFVTFTNGSTLEFGYADSDSDIYQFQSAEYSIVYIDEATHMSPYQIQYITSRIRGANEFPHQLKMCSNPGNQSHVFLRERFIEPMPPLTRLTVDTGDDLPLTRIFIPSTVYENKFLMEADPRYVQRLKALPEEERRQLLEGDWYVFSGQFFPEFKQSIHVISENPKPTKDWRIYFSCDYGLDCFAGYFIAENDRGFAYVLGEIHQENVIISDAAKMIKAKQRALGIAKVDEYLLPSDLWNRRQETGKSVADIFRENGIPCYKASRDRVSGWASVKEWLKPFKDEQDILTSKLKINRSCVDLIKCIPSLQYDEHRPGDANAKDHSLTHSTDALRYFCITRTRANKERKPLTADDIAVDREYRQFNSNSMYDVYGGNEHGNDSDYYNSTTNWSF